VATTRSIAWFDESLAARLLTIGAVPAAGAGLDLR